MTGSLESTSTMSNAKVSSVRIDSEVLRDAGTVAHSKGLSVAEYISSKLRPIVKRELEEYARTILEGSKPEGKPKARGKKGTDGG